MPSPAARRVHLFAVMEADGLFADLTGVIIGGAIRVHEALGPGLLESAYLACLVYELVSAGLQVEVEKPLPVVYRGVRVECGYRLDILVNGCVIVEIKAVERFAPIHKAQMITYLKLARLKVGLILNFNVPAMRDGVKRIVFG